MSVIIRSSVFFGWRCRPGGGISAVWVCDNERFARSRENSGTFNHALGLRNCSPVARDQGLVASKRLEIDLVRSANGMQLDLEEKAGREDGPLKQRSVYRIGKRVYILTGNHWVTINLRDF